MPRHTRIIEHYQKRLNAAVNRSPLLKLSAAQTGRILDCARLSVVDEELPKRLLSNIIDSHRSTNVDLRLGARHDRQETRSLFGDEEEEEDLNDRERSLIYHMLDRRIHRHGELAKRETGVHSIWFGYPLIYVPSLSGDSKIYSLAPLFLWPVSVEPDLSFEGRVRIQKDKDSGHPKFNLPAQTWIQRNRNVALPNPDEDALQNLDWEALKELAGSGLRQLQYVWRTQRRRPPQMESNVSANTFTLTLDWRLVPDNYNSFWKDRLGVKLSQSEATILNLSVDGLGVEEAASATGLPLDSAQEALNTLVRQALVDEKKGRFFIKDHLRDLLREDADTTADEKGE